MPASAVAASDRARGVLLGAIVGDAFGAPLEGAPLVSVSGLVDRRARDRGPWRYTDDGAMTLAVSEALTTSRTIDAGELLRRLSKHYEPARGFGRGMELSLAAFSAGTPWDRCAFAAWPEGSRGNGGAVRVAPLVLPRWSSRRAFDAAVQLATRVTHAHPEALAFAELQASAVAAIFTEPSAVDEPAQLLSTLSAQFTKSLPVVCERLMQIRELLQGRATRERAAQTLGTSTLACESVPAALWAFLAHHQTFSESITAAARLGGDVDSICCIVGSLAGALHGASAIEPQWLENLAHDEPAPHDLIHLADELLVLQPEMQAVVG